MSESRLIKNKKILVLANYDIGLYKFRKALLEELIWQGNEVYISLPYGDLIPELEKLGCRFIDTTLERRGMNPVRDIRLYYQYRRMIKDIRPDLVLAYTVKPNIYGGLACRKEKVPFAANITGLGSAIEGGGMLRKLVFSMYKTALAKAKIIFFENAENQDILVNAGVVKKEKTHVLHGAGIDTEEYPLLPYPAEKPVHFLFVGRIMKEKGVDELFEAITRLKAEYGNDVVLDVVGIFEEADQLSTEQLHNNGTIVFHGYQQDVKPFYERAHCVVLPSYHEGMSNVLLEAASCGRALITCNIHGCKEAVEDGVGGYLCDKKDAESLYRSMKRFLELSQSEKERLGIAGRSHMKKTFDKKQVVAETMERLCDE